MGKRLRLYRRKIRKIVKTVIRVISCTGGSSTPVITVEDKPRSRHQKRISRLKEVLKRRKASRSSTASGTSAHLVGSDEVQQAQTSTQSAPAGTSIGPAGSGQATLSTQSAPGGTSIGPAGCGHAATSTQSTPAGTSIGPAVIQQAEASTQSAPAGTSIGPVVCKAEQETAVSEPVLIKHKYIQVSPGEAHLIVPLRDESIQEDEELGHGEIDNEIEVTQATSIDHIEQEEIDQEGISEQEDAVSTKVIQQMTLEQEEATLDTVVGQDEVNIVEVTQEAITEQVEITQESIIEPEEVSQEAIAEKVVVTQEAVAEQGGTTEETIIEQEEVGQEEKVEVTEEAAAEQGDTTEEMITELEEVSQEEKIEVTQEAVAEQGDTTEEMIIEREEVTHEDEIEKVEVTQEAIVELEEVIQESITEQQDVTQEVTVEQQEVAQEAIVEQDQAKQEIISPKVEVEYETADLASVTKDRVVGLDDVLLELKNASEKSQITPEECLKRLEQFINSTTDLDSTTTSSCPSASTSVIHDANQHHMAGHYTGEPLMLSSSEIFKIQNDPEIQLILDRIHGRNLDCFEKNKPLYIIKDGKFPQPAIFQFNQPLFCEGDLGLRVFHHKISLEYCFYGNGNEFTGFARVSCSVPKGSVFVRYTLDNWASYEDVTAKLIKENYREEHSDRFVFDLPYYSPGCTEFALCFESEDGGVWWDNNWGKNYRVGLNYDY